MSSKRYIIVFSVLFMAFLGFYFLVYQDKIIPEERVVQDIEKQIITRLKEDYEINSEYANVKIELFEDILNTRFIVYSFNDPTVRYRHAGYAIYQIRDNRKFRRISLGWNSSTFNMKILKVSENKEEKRYIMVYGMNNSNEKQIYQYTCGAEKRIEEFNGGFFLKKYTIDKNPISFKKIDSK